jgi:hypothetical protein
MVSRLLLLFLLCMGTQVIAQKHIGDTLELLYWPDNGQLNRIQTRDSSGLILCRYYSHTGFLSSTGWLKDNSKPLSDRKTGVWTYVDSSGNTMRRELYRKGETIYTTYFHVMNGAQMYDSLVKTGRHHYERYRYRNGVLYYFCRTRRPWVENSIHHLQYKLHLRDNYYGESDDVLTIVYDTTGELVSRQKYFLGNDRSLITVTDSTITKRKKTLWGHEHRLLITDTSGGILESTKYYLKSFTPRYNYSAVRKYKKYNKQGILIREIKDRRCKEVITDYYSDGGRRTKSKSKWCGEFRKRWDESGKRKMIMRDWSILYFHRYTRITWSDNPRERTITHQRPSRFPMF